ncbi:MAG: hypothetical protein M1308_23225 [Actinobacteria bacterium]|nr:hypothetical protein [Actinomycetota bacterium]
MEKMRAFYKNIRHGELEPRASGIVRRQLKAGREFVREEELNKILELKGNDEQLLCLYVGLQVLNTRRIDWSQVRTTVSESDQTFSRRFDTDETTRIREAIRELREYTETFIRTNYPDVEDAIRARDIQIAVTNLFAQTYHKDISGQVQKQLEPKTIEQWAKELKPRIQPSAQ